MRRSWSIATFVLLLGSIPVVAQHGGGHAGGGHAGFSGGHAGFSGGHAAGHVGGFAGHSGFSGSRASGAMRSNPGFAHSSVRPQYRAGSSHGPFLHNGTRGVNNGTRGVGTRGVRFRTVPSRSRCFGFPCRGYLSYPWGYAGFYDPYWWWDSGSSSYDDDYESNQAIANQMNQQSLDDQQMRDQEQDQDQQDQYDESGNQRQPYARTSPASAEAETEQPATLLVFRDQHKLEIRNYAIVGQTLWNFAPQRTQKIPLSDLDLTATTKANDERGMSFRVPFPGEAQ